MSELSDKFMAEFKTALDSLNALYARAAAPEAGPVIPPTTPATPLTNPYGASGSTSNNPYVNDPTKLPGTIVNPETADQILALPVVHEDKSGPIVQGMKVLAAATKQQGKPYGWGATGPDRWDCSALAQWAYKTAVGIDIGRTTYDQIKKGQTVKFSESRAGDLIFSNFENGDMTRPGHVSINMDGPDNVFEAGDPVGVYKWGNRGIVIVKRYV